MDFTMSYIMASIGTVMTLFWVFIFLKYSNKYNEVIKSIKPNEYLLHFIFFIGFGTMDIFKFNIYSSNAKKRIKVISEIKGEKYAQFYFFVKTGGQITYVLTFLPLFIFISAMTKDFAFAALGVLVSVGLAYYLDYEINEQVQKRREELISDFPMILSKLALLLNAGLTLREAWAKTACTGTREMYKEMKITMDEMNNGFSDDEALRNLMRRCPLIEVRKFSSSVIQNLKKGSSELSYTLKDMADQSWEEKKHRVKQKGELASSKLLVPVMLMFIGILIMIMVPVFTTL